MTDQEACECGTIGVCVKEPRERTVHFGKDGSIVLVTDKNAGTISEPFCVRCEKPKKFLGDPYTNKIIRQIWLKLAMMYLKRVWNLTP